MMKLILINGAIASGKTTIGKALAIKLRELSEQTSFFDIDDEVLALHGSFEWQSDEERNYDWLLAKKACAAKTKECLEKGYAVVTVGPFFTAEEIRTYLQCIEQHELGNVEVYLFTLIAPLSDRIMRDSQRHHTNAEQDIVAQQMAIDNLTERCGVEIENTTGLGDSVDKIIRAMEWGIGRVYF